MANILHTLKAALYDNALTENPNDFVARVQSERSLSVKDICTFAATSGGVDSSDIVINKPSELIVVIPELKSGAYALEVVTQYGGNSKQLLKEPRTAVLEKMLTVS